MEQIILVVHLLVALAIIGLILMQRGKGSDIGASFGGGASQTLFGSAGNANVLTKSTAWLVVAFFSTSFGLAVIADSRTANDDDLGFELPVETFQQAQEPELTLPQGDLPEVAPESVEPQAMSDLPATDDAGIDLNKELPEG